MNRNLAPVPPLDPAADARHRTIQRFDRHIRATRTGGQKTAVIYLYAVNNLAAWMTEHGRAAFTDLDADDLDDFFAAHRDGTPPFTRPHAEKTIEQQYKSLRVFFKWVADRPATDKDWVDPMERAVPRTAGNDDIVNKVLTDEQLRAVLATVTGRRDFQSVRDLALLQVLLSGVRRGELAALTVADVDLDTDRIWVKGKGDSHGTRGRWVVLGPKTMAAVDDYLELRERHKLSYLPNLWLGRNGPVTGRGIHSIVSDRGEQAGIPGLHPHMFRHTHAHRWLMAGGNETDLMENEGWSSPAMLKIYAKTTRAERAQAAARKLRLDEI